MREIKRLWSARNEQVILVIGGALKSVTKGLVDS